MQGQKKNLGLAAIAILFALLLIPGPGLAQGPNRVGLVVKFGDGGVEKRCIEFSESEITGLEVLQRSGLGVEYMVSGPGAMVCKIGRDGCPPPYNSYNDCLCQCPGGANCVYWSYWHLKNGGWEYSSAGASGYKVKNGDVEGWVWAKGEVGSAPQPPSTSFDDVCPPPIPTPTTPPPPDSDNDGVLDNVDGCPAQPGPAENSGCPWPDGDGDGLTDNVDGCPAQPGPAENGGCPWPDGDGDGLADNVDGCPAQPGPAENNGCPLPTETPTSKPPEVNFSAEPNHITAGGCATLHWDVENAKAAYLDGQGVTGHENRQVCPSQTQTYELRVEGRNGEEVKKQVTVEVAPAPPGAAASPPAEVPPPPPPPPPAGDAGAQSAPPPPTEMPTPSHAQAGPASTGADQPPTPTWTPTATYVPSPTMVALAGQQEFRARENPRSASTSRSTLYILLLMAEMVGAGGLAFLGSLALLGAAYFYFRRGR